MSTLLPVINQTSGCENREACADCGGKCCQSYAGIAYPSDFGPRATLVETLVEYLRSGFWCLDNWEGDPREPKKRTLPKLDRVWFIRPQHTNRRGRLTDESWGGTCCLWNAETGCSLAFHNRPRECRELIPDKSSARECKSPLRAKQDAAIAWIRYQRKILEALRIVEQSK